MEDIMEETISPSLNPVQLRREDKSGVSASRKSDVKYLQNKAM
jgi:hypothetical protein